MSDIKREELLPGLWRFEDTCNVYVIAEGDKAIAVDFGSGEWRPDLEDLGIKSLEHVFLTHHHRDQCEGLIGLRKKREFVVHAPVGEERFLAPEQTKAYHPGPWPGEGCPISYTPPAGRIAGIQYDVAGDVHTFWQSRRIRFVSTPGHGPNACSIVIDCEGQQVVFCGDAAHANGTIWQPFHLEWDHWTGQGALAAWEGVMRLAGIGVDLLCPAHGPVIARHPRPVLLDLAERLMDFYHAKGQISPGEPDRYLRAELLPCGALKYLPRLYQYGGNGYLLVSESGEGLVVDPTMGDMPALEALLAERPEVRPTAMVVSHYHCDHCDAIPYLREKFGAEAWLHPTVAAPWQDPAHTFLPWLLPEPTIPEHIWPEKGTWQWQEYEFLVAHWPGQTWGHCAFMTTVDGKRVFFAGDSYVPSSRWNGTGGFCAYNGSRFREGFMVSAQMALDWQPDIMAGGHGNCYAFAPSKFRKIIAWAEMAEETVRALCPSGRLREDYYGVHEVVRKATLNAERRIQKERQRPASDLTRL